MISIRVVATSALAALVASSSALAQGKSQQAKGKNKGTTAPSRIELAAPVSPASATGATPLAWIDDASLLAPGVVSLSMSAMRWSGGGASEVDFPVVDAALGLAPRLQLAASVPRVVGSADGSAIGGVGTSFFSTKIAAYEHSGAIDFKVAAAPTLQVLGEGVVASLDASESRVRWGLPFSAEISRGSTRLYGGAGYFAPGLWFTGAAIAAQASTRTFVNAGFSRAWRRSTPELADSESGRNELSGGLAYIVTPSLTMFGSVGRTIATLPENGAGTSIVGGLSLSFASARP